MIRFYQTDASVHEIPGAAITFRRLHEAGIKVALDTGFTRDIVDVLLERLDWNDPSSDRCHRHQRRSQARTSARRHGRQGDARFGRSSDAEHVAKVGDTPADLQEGTSAGCGMVIGVTGGSHTAEQLRPFGHTHLVASVAEVPGLLGL